MLKKSSLIVIVAALALIACSPQALTEPALRQSVAGAPPAQPVEKAELSYEADASAAYGGAVVAQSPTGNMAQAQDRLVIKNANLALVVKDAAASVNSITALAESLNGFVVNSNVYQSSTDAAGNKIMSASITIRVPAEKLSDALAQLRGMAVRVESEGLSGEDVTSQYTDLESQLRNLEAAEKQLQAIMEGARRTEDVLNVYNQLVSIRGQIEQVKGQMKYFRESAAMSLISINLIPDALSQPLEVGGWRPEGVAKDAIEALLRALQDVATAVIWLGIYVLPLGLLFGLPLWLIGRVAVRRLRKPKPSATA
jgi:hypothetical protein